MNAAAAWRWGVVLGLALGATAPAWASEPYASELRYLGGDDLAADEATRRHPRSRYLLALRDPQFFTAGGHGQGGDSMQSRQQIPQFQCNGVAPRRQSIIPRFSKTLISQ